MVMDGLAQAVHRQLGLGRLLPLGEPSDGLWLAERPAVRLLTEAAATVTGVRLGDLRLALDDPASAVEPSVPAPHSALPPGPLCVDADFAASATEPLPRTAAQLRAALADAASRRLGLVVARIDLRVTALLDETKPRPDLADPRTEPEDPGPQTGQGRDPGPDPNPDDRRSAPATRHTPLDEADSALDTAVRAAAAVPGVIQLDPVLAEPESPRGPDRFRDASKPTGPDVVTWPEWRADGSHRPSYGGSGDRQLPTRHHLLLQLAVTEKRCVAQTALAAREAALSALATSDGPAPVTVAVLVTEIDQG